MPLVMSDVFAISLIKMAKVNEIKNENKPSFEKIDKYLNLMK
jgi:hypothetical protein